MKRKIAEGMLHLRLATQHLGRACSAFNYAECDELTELVQAVEHLTREREVQLELNNDHAWGVISSVIEPHSSDIVKEGEGPAKQEGT